MPPVAQDDLNALYVGPQFSLAYRLSVTMNVVFVAIVYCGGLPIMVPVGAVSIAALYWVRCALWGKCACVCRTPTACFNVMALLRGSACTPPPTHTHTHAHTSERMHATATHHEPPPVPPHPASRGIPTSSPLHPARRS